MCGAFGCGVHESRTTTPHPRRQPPINPASPPTHPNHPHTPTFNTTKRQTQPPPHPHKKQKTNKNTHTHKQDLYKNRPEEVTPRLVANIVRDSCDPGALGVFASGGRLPTPRPANELLAKFGGPVLVAQGMLDPLNDARGRAALLERAHGGVEVAALDGGHCPHDEVPEQLAAALRAFVGRVLGGEEEGRVVAAAAPAAVGEGA